MAMRSPLSRVRGRSKSSSREALLPLGRICSMRAQLFGMPGASLALRQSTRSIVPAAT